MLAPALILLMLATVVIHESGHFLAARAAQISVAAFSIGLARPLWRRRLASGLELRLGWLPLGGAVLPGADWQESSVARRALVTVGGSATNLLIAGLAAALAAGLPHGGWPVIGEDLPHWLMDTSMPPLAVVLTWLAWMNLMFGATNLLPIAGLDGERLLLLYDEACGGAPSDLRRVRAWRLAGLSILLALIFASAL